MNNAYRRYTFAGSVKDSFSRIICHAWHGATYATSAAKALANLSYQFKKTSGLAAYARIELDGNIFVE